MSILGLIGSFSGPFQRWWRPNKGLVSGLHGLKVRDIADWLSVQICECFLRVGVNDTKQWVFIWSKGWSWQNPNCVLVWPYYLQFWFLLALQFFTRSRVTHPPHFTAGSFSVYMAVTSPIQVLGPSSKFFVCFSNYLSSIRRKYNSKPRWSQNLCVDLALRYYLRYTFLGSVLPS